MVLDSEEEVDATLDDSSSSGSSTPIDCSGLPHLFDRDDQVDRHLDEDDEYGQCTNQPCPNRNAVPGHLPGPSNYWADPIEPHQFAPLPQSVSPSPAPTPLPPVSPVLSPAHLEFALPPLPPSPTPSIDLDFGEDFSDSPQFFLYTMGDI